MYGRKDPPRSRGSPPHSAASVKTIVTFFLFGACCFYAGILVGAHTAISTVPTQADCPKCRNLESVMAGRINNQADKIDGLKKGLEEGPRFPLGVSSFATGMAVLPREEFAKKFDVGVPLDKMNAHNDQVILLYSGKDSLPTSDADLTLKAASSNTQIPLMDNIETATENCDMVNLILAQPNDKRQCFAVMGQFRSYHIQKFMRLPEPTGEKSDHAPPLDHSAPLRLVNRGAQSSGRLSAKPPTKQETEEYWVSLTKYLQTLDHVLGELKPLAEKVAKDNTGTAKEFLDAAVTVDVLSLWWYVSYRFLLLFI